MLAAKMDLLMKKLESPHQEANQIMDSRMTCETCEETGHMCNCRCLQPSLLRDTLSSRIVGRDQLTLELDGVRNARV